MRKSVTDFHQVLDNKTLTHKDLNALKNLKYGTQIEEDKMRDLIYNCDASYFEKKMQKKEPKTDKYLVEGKVRVVSVDEQDEDEAQYPFMKKIFYENKPVKPVQQVQQSP